MSTYFRENNHVNLFDFREDYYFVNLFQRALLLYQPISGRIIMTTYFREDNHVNIFDFREDY